MTGSSSVTSLTRRRQPHVHDGRGFLRGGAEVHEHADDDEPDIPEQADADERDRHPSPDPGRDPPRRRFSNFDTPPMGRSSISCTTAPRGRPTRQPRDLMDNHAGEDDCEPQNRVQRSGTSRLSARHREEDNQQEEREMDPDVDAGNPTDTE